MAITTLDQLIAAMPGQHRHVLKASATTEGAGTYFSLWKLAGMPGAGSNPPAYTAGSGYIPTRTTVGAIPFTNPVSGYSYLARLSGAGSVVGTLILYDRLWTCSGFSTTVITSQVITTPGVVDRPDGNDVELWIEIYTAPGATTATWTVSYTDIVNGASRTGIYTHPANAETANQLCPVLLQAGDTGVSAVASLTCSVTSGTAGNVGITLLRRVAEIPLTVVNVAQVLDAVACGMPRIYDSACLALMIMCSGTSSGLIQSAVDIVQG